MNKEAEYTVIDQYYQKRGKDMFECIRKNTSIIDTLTGNMQVYDECLAKFLEENGNLTQYVRNNLKTQNNLQNGHVIRINQIR